MRYRQLGTAGLKVSVIGLGTNQFGGKVDLKAVEAILGAAIERGINFIDTADIYQDGRSESTLGEALEGRRQQVFLATKVGMRSGEGPNATGASRHRIAEGVEGSLRRLKTDHIDLYQIHQWDAETPVAETMRALDDLVRAGKVRYVGASNFAAWQIARANTLAELKGWTPFVSVQPHWHMLERELEKELLPFCNADRIGILPYFPLAGGFLTGKYRRGEAPPTGSRGSTSSYVQHYMTEANYERIEGLERWVRERGRTLAELAVAWLLARPAVSSVIAGATRIDHVELAARAYDFDIAESELAQLELLLG